MKKETLKELGKYFLDVSKIVAALAVITPMIKDESISYSIIGVVVGLFMIGTFLTNKGAKDE